MPTDFFLTRFLQKLPKTSRNVDSIPSAKSSLRCDIDAFELEARILYSAAPLPVDLLLDAPSETADLDLDLDTLFATSEPLVAQVEADIFQLQEDRLVTQSSTIVFIDEGVENYERLIKDAQAPNTFVYLITNDTDGVQQITDILSNHSNVAALHVVSHGNEGTIQLGDTSLSIHNLDNHSNAIASWQASLLNNADILLYGCELASSQSGEELIEGLALLSGAEIAASDDLTGHDSLDGDWDLEYTTGAIEADVIFSALLQNEYVNTLNVTFDDLSGRNVPDGATSATFQHVTSGSERLMLVGVSFGDDGGGEVTSVTYDGVNLFRVGFQESSNGDDARVEVWALVAPDVGNNQIRINYNGNQESTVVGAMTFNGVDQITPLGNFVSANGTSSTPSASTSSYYGELVYSLLSFHNSNNVTFTEGLGQFEMYDGHADHSNGTATLELGSPTTDSTWTVSENDEWALATIAIKAATPIDYGGVLTVTTADDVVDGDVTSADSLIFNSGADGEISLREAILALNATPNGATPDEIHFDIAGSGIHTIQLTGPRLELTDSVIIDGSTQSGYTFLTPMIEIDGSSITGADKDIFRVTANNTTIRGLVLNNAETAILLESQLNTIVGNFIGTDTTGANARGNVQGIVVTDDANTIGGVTAADRNIISGNLTEGIAFEGNFDSETMILGNYIGVGADGSTALGNGGHGILLTGNATDNRIGGIGAGEANIIAHNGHDGISLVGARNGNTIRGNLIYANNDLGIDINNDGVTANDAGDSDNGPNRVQNFPVLVSANYSGTSLTVTGNVTGRSNAEYTVDIYTTGTASAASRYLTSVDVTTDASGNAILNVSFSALGVSPDESITATSTYNRNVGSLGFEGSTSEFSQDLNVNFSPVITATSFLELENSLSAGQVLVTDLDTTPNDTISWSITGNGADDALFSINPNNGRLRFNNLPDFESPADLNGDNIYEVEVQVSDGFDTDTETVSITLGDVNEDPVISSDGGSSSATLNIDENTTVVTTVVATDEDVPAQTLNYNITGGADQSLFNIDSNGDLTFNAARDFETFADADNNGAYEVEVTADDGVGGSDVQTIRVIIDDVNEDPVIVSDGGGSNANVNVAENTTAVTTIVATDIDSPTQVLSYDITGGADQAFFNIDTLGVLAFDSSKDFETPIDANADGTYEVQVTVNDANGGSDIQNISVIIGQGNDAPTAENNSYTLAEGGTLNVAAPGVLDNDTDVDLDTLTAMLLTGTSNGSISLNTDGSFTYTHDDTETTTDSFTYQISDGNGGFDTATVNLNITLVNEAPTVDNPIPDLTVDEDGVPSTFDLADVFADVDSSTLSYTVTSNSNASLIRAQVVGNDLVMEYEPDQFGTASLTIEARDASGLTTTQVLNVTVDEVNDTPVIVNQTYGNAQENITTGNLLTNAFDVENQSLVVRLIDGPDNGTITLNPDGTFEFFPDDGFSGVDTITFEATDGIDFSNTATAEFIVTAVAPAPTTTVDTENDSEEQEEELAPPPESRQVNQSTADEKPESPIEIFTTVQQTQTAESEAESGDNEQSRSNAATASQTVFASTGGVVEATLVSSSSSNASALSQYELFSSLDILGDDLKQVSENVSFAFVSSVVSLSGVSIGVVTWVLRTGALMASMMANVPTWRTVDPLAVLGYANEEHDDDDESLLDIVDDASGNQEQEQDTSQSGQLESETTAV